MASNSDRMNKQLANVDDWLDSLGYCRKTIAHDETCFFRAVAEQVFGSQLKHERVREECITYGKQHYSEFRHLCPIKHEWFERLKKLRICVCKDIEIEIALVCNKYQMDLVLFDAADKRIKSFNGHPPYLDHSIIHLCKMSEHHYDAVYKKNYIADAGFCQSIPHKVLYENVFNIPNVTSIANDKQASGNDESETDDGSAMNTDGLDQQNMLEPLPFTLVEALDPNKYCNTDYDFRLEDGVEDWVAKSGNLSLEDSSKPMPLSSVTDDAVVADDDRKNPETSVLSDSEETTDLNINNDERCPMVLPSKPRLELSMMTSNDSDIDEKPFSCSVCKYRTAVKYNLDKHMKIHTGEKPYYCKVCEYRTAHKHHFVTHMKFHTGDQPFSCSVCKYRTAVKFNLVRHMKIHTGEKSYSCSVCGYKCVQKNTLVLHIKTHTGEKPFSCSVCEYRAVRKYSLVSHMKNHTGEKPYYCNVCEYRTAHKHHLVTHMTFHTGDQPFFCSVCKYRTAVKSHLVDHMKIHTGEKPYSCSICGYKSVRRSTIALHIKTHTGEKPFSCSVCKYKAARKDYLVSHMKTHTGEKPYSCLACGYATAYKQNLVAHIKSHIEER